MKYFKSFLFTTIALLALSMLVTSAYALSISPTNPDPYNTGTDTSMSAIRAILNSDSNVGTELYKSDFKNSTDGELEESGTLTNSYSTTYDSADEPSGATITYTGGDYISLNPFLLVKDGNNDPAWYLFDLGASSWNGMEYLELTDFWSMSGAISHVALYGDKLSPSPTPEPATMLLFGIGLLGIARYSRRRK